MGRDGRAAWQAELGRYSTHLVKYGMIRAVNAESESLDSAERQVNESRKRLRVLVSGMSGGRVARLLVTELWVEYRVALRVSCGNCTARDPSRLYDLCLAEVRSFFLSAGLPGTGIDLYGCAERCPNYSPKERVPRQESIPIFVEIAEAVPCVSHAAFASL